MNNISELVKFNDSSLPESFVALAVELGVNNQPYHAAILIRLNGEHHLHHYWGQTQVISDFETDKIYVYKTIDFIAEDDEEEVGAFLEHCYRVCENSNMTYSCVIDGSGYDTLGRYIPNSGLPELGTCVGFCLNTLSAASLGAPYLMLSDWDASTIPEDSAHDAFGHRHASARYPDLNWSEYNAFRKRISPLEYLCSAFFDVYPIRKAQIDSVTEQMLDEISRIAA